MENLRRTCMLARAVLVWFALYVGVSVASPVVSPQAFAIICSSTGALMLVDQGDAHDSGKARHALDCPLCLSTAPPPRAVAAYQPPAPSQTVCESQDLPPLARVAEGPWSARGPPFIS